MVLRRSGSPVSDWRHRASCEKHRRARWLASEPRLTLAGRVSAGKRARAAPEAPPLIDREDLLRIDPPIDEVLVVVGRVRDLDEVRPIDLHGVDVRVVGAPDRLMSKTKRAPSGEKRRLRLAHQRRDGDHDRAVSVPSGWTMMKSRADLAATTVRPVTRIPNQTGFPQSTRRAAPLATSTTHISDQFPDSAGMRCAAHRATSLRGCRGRLYRSSVRRTGSHAVLRSRQ